MGVVNPNPVQAGTETGSSYVPLAPQRILDTRITGNPLGNNSSENLAVTGIDSVPADATAVVLNVTVTASSNESYLTVYAAGESSPKVSNLNFSQGETVANLTVVPVGVNGRVTIYNAIGEVQVIVDLEGYFEANSGSSTAGSYVALTPARITDTRSGSGDPNSGAPLGPGGTLNVHVDGEGGVPSTGVEAVALNVTVTDTTQYSDLTAYPGEIAMPLASNLNWWPGDTVANRVIVPVGASGQVSIYNSRGDADLVVDVVGYFSDGTSTPSNASFYYPMSPIRVLDSTLDAGTPGANSYLSEQFAGVDGISSTANAILANLTSTNATEPGYFSVVPEQATPITSDVNFSANQTVPNLVIATLNSQGGANIYNAQGTAAAIADVFGYFQPEGTPSSPQAAATGFVGRSGAGLTLNGQAYRFTGINIYMAASGGTPSSCGGELYPNVSVPLSQLPRGTVFRFWAFQDFFASGGVLDWANFDSVLSIAASYGDRVIPVLANQYAYCDGPAKDLAWYQSGYKNTVYPGDAVTYRQYVADVVARYADNPTVAMWQLVNEGEAVNDNGTCNEPAALSALLAFSNDVGGMVHGVDPNHLVSSGTLAGWSGAGIQWCGAQNADYQTLMASPGNDVCDFHDYGYPTDPMGNPSAPDLASAITMCHADGKPIMVAETGIYATSAAGLAPRAAEFSAKFSAQFQAGVVGELLWCWANIPDYVVPAADPDYGIAPGEPALGVLGTF
jgi:hypothetical protein